MNAFLDRLGNRLGAFFVGIFAAVFFATFIPGLAVAEVGFRGVTRPRDFLRVAKDVLMDSIELYTTDVVSIFKSILHTLATGELEPDRDFSRE